MGCDSLQCGHMRTLLLVQKRHGVRFPTVRTHANTAASAETSWGAIPYGADSFGRALPLVRKDVVGCDSLRCDQMRALPLVRRRCGVRFPTV